MTDAALNISILALWVAGIYTISYALEKATMEVLSEGDSNGN